MTDSLDVSYVQRIIVFGYVLIGNIADFHKSFKKELVKANKLGWKLRFNGVIYTELFIWVWIMTEYYGSLYLKNNRMNDEEYLFRKIHKNYFDECMQGIYYDSSAYNYNFWRNCITDILNTSPEDYEGIDYDHRVKEKMIRMFSAKIFKYIKPNLLEMNIEDINEKYGNKIVSIQKETETIFYFSVDLFMHCLVESSRDRINITFEKIRTEKIVKRIIEELVKL